MAALVNDATARDNSDFDKLRASTLTRTTRSDVLGVACDPERIDAQFARRLHQQSERPPCIAVTSVPGVDGKANMSCVQIDVLTRTIAQVDVPELVAENSMQYSKEMSWRLVQRMRSHRIKLEDEFVIFNPLHCGCYSGLDEHSYRTGCRAFPEFDSIRPPVDSTNARRGIFRGSVPVDSDCRPAPIPQ